MAKLEAASQFIDIYLILKTKSRQFLLQVLIILPLFLFPERIQNLFAFSRASLRVIWLFQLFVYFGHFEVIFHLFNFIYLQLFIHLFAKFQHIFQRFMKHLVLFLNFDQEIDGLGPVELPLWFHEGHRLSRKQHWLRKRLWCFLSSI